ncbi:hypothetical protein BY996DRAFT_6431042 [Phakopsora pachyrhizi]|uniref:RRM domain-containing protein n=1 Tax=Phakopsora pachyrhizi TaxID=170000 RepID=A0AAV0BK78_PHAPC|nr:hypothetical protein BY996DRAFT_6431042 [Phakopsora pachyrhizi]CAH7687433.1 hypothetical protein PPACK8108_LOCUS22211 [Phakopsora pachyrhizi]
MPSGPDRLRSRSPNGYGSSSRRSVSPPRAREAATNLRDRPIVSGPPVRPRHAPQDVQPTNVLGVFGLSIRTRESDLEAEFSRYGKVEKVVIVYDQRSDRSRGFGFVTMRDVQDASACISELNGLDLHGRPIRVDYSVTTKPHQPTPGQYMGTKREEEERGAYDRWGGGYNLGGGGGGHGYPRGGPAPYYGYGGYGGGYRRDDYRGGRAGYDEGYGGYGYGGRARDDAGYRGYRDYDRRVSPRRSRYDESPPRSTRRRRSPAGSRSRSPPPRSARRGSPRDYDDGASVMGNGTGLSVAPPPPPPAETARW